MSEESQTALKLTIEGREVSVTHPEKLIWPQFGIKKVDYIQYLITVAPYLLPYTFDRMLMMWCYPHGITGKRIEKRSRPPTAPSWLPNTIYKGKSRIFLNDMATLAWVADYGALELHVPFDRYWKMGYPTELAFDLDPSDPSNFELVLETALKLREILDSLGLVSVPKTSGATGMQIFVPIEPVYTFEETRRVNQFIAEYLVQQLPDRLTLDRVVLRRGNKLYFDYLQLWKGRTLPAPYSVRAGSLPTVSTPVSWAEVETGFHPESFTLMTVPDRLKIHGDLFQRITTNKNQSNQSLGVLLDFLRDRGR